MVNDETPRLSFFDTLKKTNLKDLEQKYKELPILTKEVMQPRNGLEGSSRHRIIEDAVLDVIQNPGWLLASNSADSQLPKHYFVDESDYQYLKETSSRELAQKILENASTSVPLIEPVVQSIIVRSFDLLSQKHPSLAFYRCHIFDSEGGIDGSDYSFGSILSRDIDQYALPTAFPVIAMLPMEKLVQLYRNNQVWIASEGNWARDSVEIHPTIPPAEFKKYLNLYRIDNTQLGDVKNMLERDDWFVKQY